MTNVQLSIVTVNYNGFKDTCELIESLQKHLLSLTYEVVVVDNASRNNEADALRQRYPGVTLVKSDRNLGFAGGNNLGIKAAQGEYILLLNNDTYVKEDTFGYLIETLRQHPEAGAVSPLLLYARDERTIQYAGFTPLTSVTLRNKSIGNGETDSSPPPAPPPLHTEPPSASTAAYWTPPATCRSATSSTTRNWTGACRYSTPAAPSGSTPVAKYITKKVKAPV
jgi:GT2 family glycosyltransferase